MTISTGSILIWLLWFVKISKIMQVLTATITEKKKHLNIFILDNRLVMILFPINMIMMKQHISKKRRRSIKHWHQHKTLSCKNILRQLYGFTTFNKYFMVSIEYTCYISSLDLELCAHPKTVLPLGDRQNHCTNPFIFTIRKWIQLKHGKRK